MFPEENTLLFILDGTLRFRFGKAEYTAGANQMAFLKKDIRVEYAADTSADSRCARYIRIYLKEDVVKEFLTLATVAIRTGEQSQPVLVGRLDEALLLFVESLQPYFVDPAKVQSALTKIKLLELLFNLSRVDSDVLTQLVDLRPQHRADITTTVEDNITKPLSLHQLAFLTGRSVSSFRRDFLAIYNMPPSQWMRQRRLEKARELLLNTTMTVTDVCYTLGFETLPHFSRLFKSHFGHSPSELKGTALAA